MYTIYNSKIGFLKQYNYSRN